MLKKNEILNLIITTLESELQVLVRSAQAAHEAATHEESKAEDAHDTRGLEASYLAGAQLARLENLKTIISVLQKLTLPNFHSNDPIGMGALVELNSESQKSYYLILKFAGGQSVLYQGKKIQLITPESPMGEALLDRKVGDLIEVEGRHKTREFEIISIA